VTDPNEKPLILGPDANPVQSEKATAEAAEAAAEKTAVIFAKIATHPSNEGLNIDEEKALPSLKTDRLVAVELPPNCLIADASTRIPDESKALVQLANRAVAVMKARGAVRLPVNEQLHWAKAFVVLFQRLNQARMDRIQLAAEFRVLFESHAKYLEQVKVENVQREAAFIDGVREAYISGAVYGASVFSGSFEGENESELEEAVKMYLDSLQTDEPAATPSDPSAEVKTEAAEPAP
jgi:hypothetical protein